MPSIRSNSVGCTYTVKRLGASVEYFIGSRFFRMFSTTASIRSRAARRDVFGVAFNRAGAMAGLTIHRDDVILAYYVPGIGSEVLADFQGFPSAAATVRIRFSDFTLDSATRQLLHRGRGEIRLSPKAFDLLAALVEQRPAVLDKAGIGGLAANFLKLVAANRRLFAVPDMIRGYRKLVAHHKGEVTAEVTLAEKPNDAHIAAIKDALKAVTKRDVQVDEWLQVVRYSVLGFTFWESLATRYQKFRATAGGRLLTAPVTVFVPAGVDAKRPMRGEARTVRVGA